MRKFFLTASLAVLGLTGAQATEGMWLLNKLKQVNEADMQRLGFKLTAEDIYSINKSGVKDGVVRLGGGFCSGEMVSSTGLMLTNHHCGYSAIQKLSSVENDFLTNGFWAKNQSEELYASFGVSFLQRIEDVTDRVKATFTEGQTEEERAERIGEIAATLRKEATGGEKYISADFKEMYEGNEFFLFIYKTYPDVRLAGTPPNAIGKFGGDTDNWMWPRHTGDFALFRVYMGPDGEPAEYSQDNVPYSPKWHFKISLDGVKKGDFAMIMGYPGSTDRFLSSHGVQLALDVEQPSRVKIRRAKLDVYDAHMAQSDAVRIKYAAKHAQVSNYWKYFIGQQRGLKRLKVYDKKKQQENELMAWVNADASRKAKYGEVVNILSKGYAERAKYEKATTYMGEAAFGSEAVVHGLRLYGVYSQLKADPKNIEAAKAQAERAKGMLASVWKDYDKAIDQEVTASMFALIMEDVDLAQQPSVTAEIRKKFKGDTKAWAAAAFKTSILVDSARLNAFLAKPNFKVLENDPLMRAAVSSLEHYRGNLAAAVEQAETDIAVGYRDMVAAMREKDPAKQWYPNANSTMRLTYGIVSDYSPADAIHYDLKTTTAGILQKEDPTHDEFIVPSRQKEMILARDFGQYADENGELILNFLSENDITGGNSGSPVINANAELIGIAFDGNWEAMSGDIAYEPELQRTISVDIRYVLWTIDKFAGAKHLVDEMTLVRTPKAEPTPTPVPAAPVAPKPARR